MAAFAHGGGLDAYGCHNETATGNYHCHNPAPTSPTTRYLQQETLRLRRETAEIEKRTQQQQLEVWKRLNARDLTPAEMYLLDRHFRGYRCTEDCSGHEAGYEWAEDNDITDTDDCDGQSRSFEEGCVAWVEENE